MVAFSIQPSGQQAARRSHEERAGEEQSALNSLRLELRTGLVHPNCRARHERSRRTGHAISSVPTEDIACLLLVVFSFEIHGHFGT